jgi:hypothetical protein
MAAALQTTPHADDERARQPIQRVMAPEMVFERDCTTFYETSSSKRKAGSRISRVYADMLMIMSGFVVQT